MRILLAVVVLGALAAAALWVRSPDTHLVDASGGVLTAGVAAGPGATPELFAGAEFAEAQALLEAERWAEARARLEALLESSERDAEACLLLSRACLGQGEVPEAVDYGRKAAKLLPDEARAHYALSRALLAKLMSGSLSGMAALPEWKAAIERTLELDPAHVEARQQQILFYTFTPGLMGGDVERAKALCAELRAHDPVKADTMLALALQQDERIDEAVALCRGILAERPDANETRVTLASLHVALEEYDAADALYDEVRSGARDEQYWQATWGQARMHLDAERDLERALALLDEYVRAAPRGTFLPGLASALGKKADVLEALGRDEEADEAREAAERLKEDE